MAKHSCGLVEMSSMGFRDHEGLKRAMRAAVANHTFGAGPHPVSKGIIVLTQARAGADCEGALETYPGWTKGAQYPGQYGPYVSTLWMFPFKMNIDGEIVYAYEEKAKKKG